MKKQNNKKSNPIVYGIFCLVFAAIWLFALSDWELLLFHVIPINNVVAGVIFGVIGIISLITGFLQKKKEKEAAEQNQQM